MRTPRRTLLPASLLILVLLCTSVAGPASAGKRAERFRNKLMHFVNDERRDRGIKALREVDGLSDLAREHSIHMARQRRLFHTHDLSKKVRAWKPTSWGENVGVGGSIWRVVRMWEQSPPHMSNMVKRGFHRAGAGVVFARGAYWVTLIVIS